MQLTMRAFGSMRVKGMVVGARWVYIYPEGGRGAQVIVQA